MAPGVESPAYRLHAGDRRRRGRPGRQDRRRTGVVARGNTLVVRFTREVRDFAAWTTMPFFCAVPPTLPPKRGGRARVPRRRPLRHQRVPTQRTHHRSARNRYYGGQREHHVDGFDVDLSANSPQEVLDRIEAGKADWGYSPSARRLRAQPRPHPQVRHQQLTDSGSRSGLTVAMYALQLIAAAVQEQRGAAPGGEPRAGPGGVPDPRRRGGRPTSSCRPLVAGFRDRRIYPLEGDSGPCESARGRTRARPASSFSTHRHLP